MIRAIMLLVLFASLPQDRYESLAMKSLADAERAFAAASVEKGSREAFVAYFADDGIAVQPHPVVYKDAVKGRPLPANPKAFTLNWQPIFGDVSKSDDLGYTTGPYSLVDNSGKQPTRYGFFFSVWKRDTAGQWRVALDIGIRTPTQYEGPAEFRQAHWPEKPNEQQKLSEELAQTEEKFLSLLAKKGPLAAYEENLADECRLHVDARQPIVGKTEFVSFLKGNGTFRKGRLLFAATSHAGDLGYSYGSYEERNAGESKESGYFGHVWKRGDSGWKLVAEVLSPIPSNTR